MALPLFACGAEEALGEGDHALIAPIRGLAEEAADLSDQPPITPGDSRGILGAGGIALIGALEERPRGRQGEVRVFRRG